MDTDFKDSIMEVVNEMFRRYEVATTKCIIELIDKIGFQMSDKPTEEEIVRIASELNNNGYRFEMDYKYGLTSSVALYHGTSLVAMCEIEI